MKKSLIFIALALLTGAVSAQIKEVKSAKKTASGALDVAELTEARNLIEAAKKDPTTKDLVLTWYVDGYIWQRAFEIEDNKRFEIPIPGKPNEAIMSEAAYKALISFAIVDSLDQIQAKTNPEAKGKLEYRKKNGDQILAMKLYILNYGALEYEAQKLKNARDIFKAIVKMQSMPLITESKSYDAKDSLFIKAKAFLATTYLDLYNSQKETEVEEAKKTLDEALAAYPENSSFLGAKIEQNISENKADEALENINKVIAKQPNNFVLFWLRGIIYASKGNMFNESKADFEKAIEIKPDFYQATSSIAELYIKEGEQSYNLSNSTKNPKEAAILLEKANSSYKQAIPYLEKVLLVNPKDDSSLKTLQNLYRKLKMYDKEAEIKAKRASL